MKLNQLLFIPVFLLTAALSAADSPWLYGIHWYGDVGASDVEAMSDGKGVYVLEQVFTEPTQGNFWEEAPYKVSDWSAITAKGHTIIARIHIEWGRTVPNPGDTYTVAQFVSDCAAAAETLKNQCHIWQLGNEMNIVGEQEGGSLDPAYYIDVYKQVQAAIEAVSSPLGPQQVLVGPVSPGGVIPGIRWKDGNQYLQEMLDALGTHQAGGFGVHSYGGPGSAAGALADFQNGLIPQLNLIEAAGYTDKPVYLTEWNRAVASAADEANSAQFLQNAYSWLNTWNSTPGNYNVVAACWFIYPDDPGWATYSLLGWKTAGGTASNDLWTAFQYSAQQNFPAGLHGLNPSPVVDWQAY
jgi:hypothetical protein